MSATNTDPVDAGMLLVMGLTGSGKSHVVNLVQAGSAKEGADLHGETPRCSIVNIVIGNQLVHVVDTPGFDDTYKSDSEVLEEISRFLGAQHAYGLKLRGIIYLHRITDVRMQGSALSNLAMFQELCGKEALDHVVLCTTMWDLLKDKATGARRQQQLRTEYWADMVRHGSFVRQFNGSTGMAVALVCRLLNKEKPVVLRIQKELIDDGLPLGETLAGREVVSRLANNLQAKNAAIADLNSQISQTRRLNDVAEQRRLQESLAHTTAERQRIEESIEETETRLVTYSNLGDQIKEKVESDKAGHVQLRSWCPTMPLQPSLSRTAVTKQKPTTNELEDTKFRTQNNDDEYQRRIPRHGFAFEPDEMEPTILDKEPRRGARVDLVVSPSLVKYGDHEGENYESKMFISKRKVICDLYIESGGGGLKRASVKDEGWGL
ncbi:P-loop containing nucleoside triphosphate hydrolase protein [Podospora appendiculata]|uniref:P-loop containing nucleoside triphosphate hydrolase protein n=1 Tax=Podospora appendiculata TaxID=314037 RepID=A0AAE0X7D9_9PEZI|nr:P-loop containing nucleoside triphosphate hydrolase protein [Podospora appendiculata]